MASMDCIFSSSFSELLEKDKSLTTNHYKLQTLTHIENKNSKVPKILTENFP